MKKHQKSKDSFKSEKSEIEISKRNESLKKGGRKFERVITHEEKNKEEEGEEKKEIFPRFKMQENMKKTKTFLEKTQNVLEKIMLNKDIQTFLRGYQNKKKVGEKTNYYGSFLTIIKQIEKHISRLNSYNNIAGLELKNFLSQLRERDKSILTLERQLMTTERKLNEYKKFSVDNAGRGSLKQSLSNATSLVESGRFKRPQMLRQQTTSRIGLKYRLLTELQMLKLLDDNEKYSDLKMERDKVAQKLLYLQRCMKLRKDREKKIKLKFEKIMAEKDKKIKKLQEKINSGKFDHKHIMELEKRIKKLERDKNRISQKYFSKKVRTDSEIRSFEVRLSKVDSESRKLTNEMLKYGVKAVNPQVYPKDQVILVFTDVQDSTLLWEKDMDTTANSITVHNNLMRNLINLHNGYEVKTEGDSFFVAFTDALDAVNFCCYAQMGLIDEDRWPPELNKIPETEMVKVDVGEYKGPQVKRLIFRGLRVRMCIHVGYPIVKIDPVTNRADYFGPVVNRAARILDIARGGEIVISEEIYNEISEKVETMALRLEIIQKGNYKLKGFKGNEFIHVMYPKRLAGRINYFEDQERLSESREGVIKKIASGNKISDMKDEIDELGMDVDLLKEMEKMNVGVRSSYTEGVKLEVIKEKKTTKVNDEKVITENMDLYTRVIAVKVSYLRKLISFCVKKADFIIKNPDEVEDKSLVEEKGKAFLVCDSILGMKDEFEKYFITKTKFVTRGMRKNLKNELMIIKAKDKSFFNEHKVLKKKKIKLKKIHAKARYMQHFNKNQRDNEIQRSGFSYTKSFTSNDFLVDMNDENERMTQSVPEDGLSSIVKHKSLSSLRSNMKKKKGGISSVSSLMGQSRKRKKKKWKARNKIKNDFGDDGVKSSKKKKGRRISSGSDIVNMKKKGRRISSGSDIINMKYENNHEDYLGMEDRKRMIKSPIMKRNVGEGLGVLGGEFKTSNHVKFPEIKL